MTMRGRDRRLLAVAGFGALLLAFSPAGLALTKKPLEFATVAHGTAQASDLVRQHVDSAAYRIAPSSTPPTWSTRSGWETLCARRSTGSTSARTWS